MDALRNLHHAAEDNSARPVLSKAPAPKTGNPEVDAAVLSAAQKRRKDAEALVNSFFDAVEPESENAYPAFEKLFEPPLLKRVMDDARGNLSRGARILGWNRSTLRKKLKQYGMY